MKEAAADVIITIADVAVTVSDSVWETDPAPAISCGSSSFFPFSAITDVATAAEITGATALTTAV